MKMSKSTTLKEILNAVIFCFILHILYYAILRVGSYLMLYQHVNIYPHFETRYVIIGLILNTISLYIIPSALGLILYHIFNKTKKHRIILFLCTILAFYPVFMNIMGIWAEATFYHCNPAAFSITEHRFRYLTIHVIVLILSIIPVLIIAKNYSRSQIIWNIIILILSLYASSFFFGGYYFLYFKPIHLPFLPFSI